MAGLSLYQLTQEELRIESAIAEGEGELTPELEAALNDNQMAVVQKVTSYKRLDYKWAGEIDTLAKMIAELQKQKKMRENGRKRLKENLKDYMVLHEISKMDGEFCTAYLRNNPGKVECDEEAILQKYDKRVATFTAKLPSYIKVTVSLDKRALKDEIEAGRPTPAAQIVKDQTVVFK